MLSSQATKMVWGKGRAGKGIPIQENSRGEENPESERDPGVSWSCSMGCHCSWCSRDGRVGKWWEGTLGASWVSSLGNHMYHSLTPHPSPGLRTSVLAALRIGNQPC